MSGADDVDPHTKETIAKVVFDTNNASVQLSVAQQFKADCFLSSTSRFIAEYTARIT